MEPGRGGRCCPGALLVLSTCRDATPPSIPPSSSGRAGCRTACSASGRRLEKLGVKQLNVEMHIFEYTNLCGVDALSRIVGALADRGYVLFRKEFNPLRAQLLHRVLVRADRFLLDPTSTASSAPGASR